MPKLGIGRKPKTGKHTNLSCTTEKKKKKRPGFGGTKYHKKND